MFRDSLRQAVPSMFHRRLLLLAVIALLLMAALGLRATMMTMGSMHAPRKQQIEGALVHIRYSPTRRGRILDRNGVVLAEDRPGWNITVHYSVLSGEWVKQAARRAAQADTAWRESSDDEREALLKKYQGECARRQTEFWKRLADTAHVDVQELFERQDAIVRRVSNMRDMQLRAKWEKTLAKKAAGGDASPMDGDAWGKMSKSFTLPEEEDRGRGHDYHPILSDVSDATRLAVQDILDEPEEDASAPQSGAAKKPLTLWQKLGLVPKDAAATAKSGGVRHDTPWSKVELQLVRTRRYPCETAKVDFDRSSLPFPLKDAKPLPLVVHGIGMHVLGYTRQAGDWVPAGKDGKPKPGALSELDRHPFRIKQADGTVETDLHGLMPGDDIGAVGAEKAFEESLRGTRGMVRIRRAQSDLAGRDIHQDPIPGRDVQLSLDIKLQTRLAAAMAPEVGLTKIEPFQPRSDKSYFDAFDKTKGQLNGAAVVLDAQTGEVLAAVSSPAISLEDLQNHLGDLWADKINIPMANRISGYPLQPGSIMKPLVLASAITEGVYQPGEVMNVPGYPFVKDPHHWRDFYYVHSATNEKDRKPLGPLTLDYAIAVSSSPPFVMLVQDKEDWSGKPRMGPARWFDWADRFGLGHPTHAGLSSADDRPGFVGLKGKPTPYVDACVTGMGQGPIAVTPLQMAAAYCRLLHGHMGISATFLKRPPNWVATPPPKERTLTQAAISFVLQGMGMAPTLYKVTPGHPPLVGSLRSISVPGHPHEQLFNCPGIKVWGKSGTAQTSIQWIDYNRNGKYDGPAERIRAGDHGWTVALCAPAGETRPRFVIVTVLEYGGSGGRAAGPIANQVVWALKAEGYLEKTAKSASAPVVVNPALPGSLDNAVAGGDEAPAPADTPADGPASDASNDGASL